jgi:hypothetical protein
MQWQKPAHVLGYLLKMLDSPFPKPRRDLVAGGEMTKGEDKCASSFIQICSFGRICRFSTQNDEEIHPGSTALSLEKNGTAPWSQNDQAHRLETGDRTKYKPIKKTPKRGLGQNRN